MGTARLPSPPRGHLPGTLLQLLAAGAALFVVSQAAPYLTFDRRYAFLVERQSLTDGTLWYACFCLHVLGGIVALVTAPVLLWNGTRGGSRRVHRGLGRLYALAALGWLVPTSVGLAVVAKGGILGQLGFLGLVGLFATHSVRGLTAVRRGDLTAHVPCMLRAYAALLSAFFFRVLHRLLPAAGWDETTSYVVSTWGSLGLALLAGEIACGRFAPRAVGAPVPVTMP